MNGTNIYGIVRAMRSGSTESIVINIPMEGDRKNYACGVSIVFGGLARSKITNKSLNTHYALYVYDFAIKYQCMQYLHRNYELHF